MRTACISLLLVLGLAAFAWAQEPLTLTCDAPVDIHYVAGWEKSDKTGDSLDFVTDRSLTVYVQSYFYKLQRWELTHIATVPYEVYDTPLSTPMCQDIAPRLMETGEDGVMAASDTLRPIMACGEGDVLRAVMEWAKPSVCAP